jgi:hypothetical protein
LQVEVEHVHDARKRLAASVIGGARRSTMASLHVVKVEELHSRRREDNSELVNSMRQVGITHLAKRMVAGQCMYVGSIDLIPEASREAKDTQ